MQSYLLPLLLLTGGGRLAAAQLSSITGSVTTQLAATGSSGSAAPANPPATTTAESVSTASPTSTLAPTDVLELEPPPPAQAWCTDPIYCAGEILQAVELAQVYPDSKTFPDKPTKFGRNETVTAWNDLLASGGNLTYSELETFLNDYFVAEGTELIPVEIDPSFNASAAPFLADIADPLVSAFMVEVIGYWSDLIRETNTSALCDSAEQCDSTLIPLNHTVVVPGGRYREVYYWDSYWIELGLLNSGLPGYAKDLLENFMDEIETYDYIPNGGRKYYLNRSQPPLFTQMLAAYVDFTNDTTILERALGLADQEFNWWTTNRTLSVVSPYTNTSYDVARYDVFVNTGPRPEGYVEDWETVNLAVPALNETEAAELYKEIASGAESGWDFSARYMREPLKNVSDPLEGLRSLNVRSTIPIDLNAILASNHFKLADLYDRYATAATNATANATITNATARADLHRQQGDKGKEALLDLMWSSEKKAFYDFNMTANARSDFFSLAAFYPFWLDIFPPELETDPAAAQGAFAGINYILQRYNGSIPATLTASTLNWDFPNSWPPLVYIVAEALGHLSPNVTADSYADVFASSDNATLWSLIPEGQLGLNETDLPAQPGETANSTVTELHSIMADNATTWRDVIQHGVVQRYVSAVFCSWYSTGGSLDGLLEQLSPTELNMTGSDPSFTGHIYEKFNATDIDAAGAGGEYDTPVGFGWTNGALISFGQLYGKTLVTPTCPNIAIEEVSTGANATNLAFNLAVDGASARFKGSRIPRGA